MTVPVYIRPLEEMDGAISYAWRNDPVVWTHTKHRPDRIISPEVESDWIRKALGEPTSRRYAICVKSTNQYIGNVQLTNIDEANGKAEFHLFIGARDFWGKGIATQATRLMLDYARKQLRLKTVTLSVSPQNGPAISVYKKNGFRFMAGSQTEMSCSLSGVN